MCWKQKELSSPLQFRMKQDYTEAIVALCRLLLHFQSLIYSCYTAYKSSSLRCGFFASSSVVLCDLVNIDFLFIRFESMYSVFCVFFLLNVAYNAISCLQSVHPLRNVSAHWKEHQIRAIQWNCAYFWHILLTITRSIRVAHSQTSFDECVIEWEFCKWIECVANEYFLQ